MPPVESANVDDSLVLCQPWNSAGLEIFLALSEKKIPKKKIKEGWKITMVVTKDMPVKPKSSKRALKLSQRIAYLSEVLYVTGGGMPGASIEKRGRRDSKSLHCHH
jgi:hypothetical protein